MELHLPYRFKESDWLLLTTLILFLLISYFILPLLEGLVLGVVFAYVGLPVRNLFGRRRRLGSMVSIICIVVPLSAIFASGIIEAISQLKWLQDHQGSILAAAYESVSGLRIPPIVFDEISSGMENLLLMGLHLLASLPIFGLGTALTMGLMNFLISLCVCYFLLLDGERLREALMAFLSPESRDLHRRCLERIDRILSGIYMGSIYTAIAGGITSAAIFYLFGVPRPFAMASIVFLAGMVPFLTWLVFIPTAISRYFEFGAVDAVLFFLAGSVLVHIAELVIRPYIVYAKSSLHPLLVLLTFLGGGLVAGISGFFLAPAMAGIVMGIYQVAREDQEGCSRKAVPADESKESAALA